MNISYGNALTQEFPGTSASRNFYKALLEEHTCKDILEIGSGANPTLPPEYVRAQGLSYITSDASHEELEKADDAFERLVLDVSAGEIDKALLGKFDCILSRMVFEHIQDGQRFHSDLYRMLRPGGISIHSFSTLWALPFAVNRFLPETLTNVLLNLFNPRDRYKHEKFKAHYSWSRGPSRAMIRQFEALGFEVQCYLGFFGHPYYRRLPWLHKLERRKADFLVNHPVPQLCSYATIVLRKPEATTAS
jgi:SAM-dependent methyltransferase